MCSRNSGRFGGCWSSGRGCGGGRRGGDDIEPAAGVRDEVDVVELGDLVGAVEAPVDSGEEGALEAGKLNWSETADARVVRVRAERVAV